MSRVKVFGGITYSSNGEQLRTVLAVRSREKAAETLKISIYELTNWWSETSNPVEVQTAMSNPGMVFTRLLDGNDPFTIQDYQA